MWELYAFWSMIIFYLGARFQGDALSSGTGLSLLAFLIIGTGALGCILGGWVSRRIGEKKLARFSLMMSCILCFSSGVFYELNSVLLVGLLLIWGFFVVSDSPPIFCPGCKILSSPVHGNGVDGSKWSRLCHHSDFHSPDSLDGRDPGLEMGLDLSGLRPADWPLFRPTVARER